MKRTLQLLIALAISTMFVVSPVAAATNQGLSWGVIVGDAFNYQLTIGGTGTVTSMNEGFYMNVTGTDPVPNSITDWTQIPDISVGLWWTNGTTMGWFALVFIGFVYLGTGLVLPAGNWTLLAQVVKTYVMWNTSTTFVNSSLYWGLSLTLPMSGLSGVIQASYLKSDGVLARYSIVGTNQTSHVVQSSISVVRAGLPTEGFDIVGFLQQNILYVGAGVAVIVILGAVVCMRRK